MGSQFQNAYFKSGVAPGRVNVYGTKRFAVFMVRILRDALSVTSCAPYLSLVCALLLRCFFARMKNFSSDLLDFVSSCR